MKKVISVFIAFCTAFILVQRVNAEGDFYTSAASAILINADTGTVLYAKNENEQRAIASTTKILTALITLESGDLDTQFTVDSNAIKVEGTSMGLRERDIVTRRDLCYGMLLPSGNDAANAAAVNIAGSLSAFADLMNKKAEALGMTSSHFVTPSGLDAEGHYSTARDMAILTMAALENEDFAEICRLANAKRCFGNPPYERWLSNSNKLLWNYEGCIGVKTGFTDNARRCLVSAAKRDGVRLIAVTLNAPNDWSDHKKMLDYGFSVVKNHTIDVDLSGLCVPVISDTESSMTVVPETAVEIAVTDEELSRIETRITVEPFIYSGFERGAKAGKIDLVLDGKVLKTVLLVTSEGCNQTAEPLNFLDGIIQFFKKLF
ncbi:MAG: D-alanyl-D-alanine carboxypeptidase family protein [Ruminiclostridium sp.]